MTLFEGWSQQALDGIDWADHTYIKCPPIGQFFDCWADNHTGADQRKIVTGDGNYALANCYRGSFWPLRDTACIGIYAIDGVCHQSANCFLFSTGVTLNFNVRGYWLSMFMYGPYGKQFARWLAIYGGCYWLNPKSGLTAKVPANVRAGGLEDAVAGSRAADQTDVGRLKTLHASHLARSQPPHPHEVIVDETAVVTENHVPGFDRAKIRDLQFKYLEQKEAIIRTETKGKDLVDKINDVARRAQKELAKRLNKDEYHTLMGVESGEVLNLVEQTSADAAGRPVPVPAEAGQKHPGT